MIGLAKTSDGASHIRFSVDTIPQKGPGIIHSPGAAQFCRQAEQGICILILIALPSEHKSYAVRRLGGRIIMKSINHIVIRVKCLFQIQFRSQSGFTGRGQIVQTPGISCFCRLSEPGHSLSIVRFFPGLSLIDMAYVIGRNPCSFPMLFIRFLIQLQCLFRIFPFPNTPGKAASPVTVAPVISFFSGFPVPPGSFLKIQFYREYPVEIDVACPISYFSFNLFCVGCFPRLAIPQKGLFTILFNAPAFFIATAKAIHGITIPLFNLTLQQ